MSRGACRHGGGSSGIDRRRRRADAWSPHRSDAVASHETSPAQYRAICCAFHAKRMRFSSKAATPRAGRLREPTAVAMQVNDRKQRKRLQMPLVQPPDQHVEEILLQELERVDKMLLEELERVDEMLLRIVAAIDQLPEQIASASRRELGSVPGNGTRAAEPVRGPASTRPFDPYGEDEVEVEAAEGKKSAARRVARKVQSWVAAYAPDREALRLANLSLAVALLATTIAVVGLIVAVLH